MLFVHATSFGTHATSFGTCKIYKSGHVMQCLLPSFIVRIFDTGGRYFFGILTVYNIRCCLEMADICFACCEGCGKCCSQLVQGVLMVNCLTGCNPCGYCWPCWSNNDNGKGKYVELNTKAPQEIDMERNTLQF
jgi:hypothetical protein